MEGLSSTVKGSFPLLPNSFLTPPQFQMPSRSQVYQGDIGLVNVHVQNKAEFGRKSEMECIIFPTTIPFAIIIVIILEESRVASPGWPPTCCIDKLSSEAMTSFLLFLFAPCKYWDAGPCHSTSFLSKTAQGVHSLTLGSLFIFNMCLLPVHKYMGMNLTLTKNG